MLTDARTLAGGEVIHSDVCIVGAGPAGLTLARELIGQRFQVCLLESGGLQFENDTQALYEGEVDGQGIVPLDSMRTRRFGGTPHQWDVDMADGRLGCRFLPLDEIDFEKREWVPYSGWPFKKADLDPYYQRAQATCGLGPYAYSPEAWKERGAPGPLFNGPAIVSSVFQFGPRDLFTERYPQEVAQAANVRALLHANLLELETDAEGESVTRARAASLQGKEFWVTAKLFVLAAGGIENARLLLLSRGADQRGLGNRHNLVGRFFMDHPAMTLGLLVPSHPGVIASAGFYDLLERNGVMTMGYLGLSPEVLRNERLQALWINLHPRPRWHRGAATELLRLLVSMARERRLSKDVWPYTAAVMKHPGSVWDLLHGRLVGPKAPSFPNASKGGWSQMDNAAAIWRSLEVVASSVEQAPDPENRVMLGSARDAFGQPRARLVWRWNEREAASALRARDLLADEIERLGLGKLVHDPSKDAPFLRSTTSYHHIGTTRMHRDSRWGVVDENCRVHGVSNLFVAGSSVFPTGGHANPTLTIVALAHRLADHVIEQMAAGNTRTDLGQEPRPPIRRDGRKSTAPLYPHARPQ